MVYLLLDQQYLNTVGFLGKCHYISIFGDVRNEFSLGLEELGKSKMFSIL